jgi:hypothetical protein
MRACAAPTAPTDGCDNPAARRAARRRPSPRVLGDAQTTRTRGPALPVLRVCARFAASRLAWPAR